MYSFADIFYAVGMLWGGLACALIIIAWCFARSSNFLMHKRVMLVMLVGGWSFVFFYLIGYILGHSYAGDVEPHIALWIALHGAVALITLVSVTLLVWARLSGPKGAWERGNGGEGEGNSSREDRGPVRSYINGHHRLIGTITAIFWLLTQAGGFINLYILR